MAGEFKAPETVARRRGERGPNKITRDLRQVIEQAFHKAGGRDYLVKVAHKRPDVFLALVGKIIPQETRVSLLASYQALPIPIEARDPIPQIAQEARGEVLDAVFTAIDAPMSAPVPASSRAPANADDWLDT